MSGAMQPTCLKLIYIIARVVLRLASLGITNPTAVWPHGTTESMLTYEKKRLSIVHSVG
jgi:hypothetical protein